MNISAVKKEISKRKQSENDTYEINKKHNTDERTSYQGKKNNRQTISEKIFGNAKTMRLLLLNIIGMVLSGMNIYNFNPVGLGYFAALNLSGTPGPISVASFVIGMMRSSGTVAVLKNTAVLTAAIIIYQVLTIGKLKLSENAAALILGIMSVIMETTDYIMSNPLRDSYRLLFSSMVIMTSLSIMTGLLCIIFKKAIDVLILGRKVFSNDEMMGIAIMTGVFIYNICAGYNMPAEYAAITAFFTVLYAAYKFGIGMGALMGMACAIPFSIWNKESDYLGMLCIMGIMIGLFRELGRLASATTMLMVGLIGFSVAFPDTMSQNAAGNAVKGMLGAVVIFLMLPRSIIYRYEENRNIDESDSIKIMFEERLMNIAKIFEQLSKSMFGGRKMKEVYEIENGMLKSISNGNYIFNDKEIENQIRGSNEGKKADKSGRKYNIKSLPEESVLKGNIESLPEESVLKGNIESPPEESVLKGNIESLPEESVLKRNIESPPKESVLKGNIESLPEESVLKGNIGGKNETYNRDMEKEIWTNRLKESRAIMSEQLEQISKIIEDYSKQVYNFVRITPEQEEYIRHRLKLKKVNLDKIVGLENNKNRKEYLVTAKCDRKYTVGSREIAQVLSEALGKNFVPSKNCRKLVSTEFSTTTYVEETNFGVRHASAKKARGDGRISGDNFSLKELENGHLLMGLSDGMGYGASACMESETVIELLEQLLDSGFDAECALKMINSVMVMNSGDEHPATLDYGVIDLHSGMCDIVKIGAAATFVKRGKWVETIKSTSMPLGIFTNVDYDSTSKKLYNGDMIIMVSDGIIDAIESENKDEELSKIISGIHDCSPKQMAEAILQCAVGGKEKLADDMTVLVTEIWENKRQAA